MAQSRNKLLAASGEFIQDCRQTTLSYVASNHLPEQGIGAYSFVVGGPPLLYASCYAALTRDLYGGLSSLSDRERDEWIAYIQSHQRSDGLFADPLIDSPEAEEFDWWGWRHLTLHAMMALTALGGTALKSFRLIELFRKPGVIVKWLESRNWQHDACNVSNEIQNYGTMLQYARDFQNEIWCGGVLKDMYNWLDEHQDPQTGYWGYGNRTAWELSQGVQTGYHLWCLYFYDGRPIRYVEQIIDSCLATQNRLGGFGVSLNSSACEDIDSIDPLVRLSLSTDYRKEEIRAALEKAAAWVLVNSNDDGGWVFRRGESLRYGHDLMRANIHQSSMFPTWFRTLSLAYLHRFFLDRNMNTFQFIKSPGLQFWQG